MHRVNTITTDMDAKEFELGKGAMLKITGRKGERLRVRSGEVWVTQYGDLNDHLLKDGDSLELNEQGMTLANASKPTLPELLGNAMQAPAARVNLLDRSQSAKSNTNVEVIAITPVRVA